MSQRTVRLAPVTTVIGATALLLVVVALRPRAAEGQTPATNAEPSQLAKDLIGAWVYAGTPEEPVDPPPAGTRLKFFTGKHWAITHSDAESSLVDFHHGGTYTLEGDEYTETIDYALESTAELVKQSFTFKIKVDGDTYTQTGVNNPYNEVWKRAK